MTSTRRRTLLGISAAGLCSLAFAGPAQADFVVDDLVNDTVSGAADAMCDAPAVAGCTLREALLEANATMPADTITFSVNGTLTLTAQLSTVDYPVTIDGNGPANTIIDGTDSFPLFFVNGAPTTFKDLRLQDGGMVDPGDDGGAAIGSNADVTLNNVVVTSNQITGVGSGFGAGIYGTGAGVTIALTNGSEVTNNTISADATTGPGNQGAGIHSVGPLNITDSTVSGNSITVGGEGGGIFADAAFSLVRTELSGNSSDAGGGLIGNVTGGTRSIVNSTISGNTGTGGGGALHLFTSTTLTNVTFANNAGRTGFGGTGDDILIANMATATMRNTIFASNDPCEAAPMSAVVSATPGNNIDEGTTCGFATGMPTFNQVNTNAMFVPALALNPPGTTKTHALTLASVPAVNMAEGTCGGLGEDQRGVMRPQGPGCDVGAFELEYRLLSAAKGGSGTGTVMGTGVSCGVDCSESVIDGTAVVLTATADAGSSFSGWTGCDSIAGNQCTQTVSGANETVTANFTADPVATPPTSTPVTAPTENLACAALRAKLKKAKTKRKKRKIRAQLRKLGC